MVVGSSPIGTAILRSSNGLGQLTFHQQIRVLPIAIGTLRSANGVSSLTGLALLKLHEGEAKRLTVTEKNRVRVPETPQTTTYA